MKKLGLFIISIVLVTSVYAASPIISVKSKSRIPGGGTQFNKAVNTATGETLISMESGDADALGHEQGYLTIRLISPNGKVSGKPFSFAKNECCFFGHSIAYNPMLQEYLVAYTPFDRSIVPYGSIFAVRLDQHGKVIGKEFTIVKGVKPEKPNDLGDNSFPHLIFNPQTNGYVLIWERTEGIAAALLDDNGKLTSSIKIIMKNPGSNGYYDLQRTFEGRIEDVQWLTSGEKLLVVFQQCFTPLQSDDWLAVLDPLLNGPAKVSKINTTPINVITGVGQAGESGDASLGILPDDTACVFYADHEIVHGRTFRNGKFTSTPFPAFSGSINAVLHVPKVAFSTTSSGTVGLLTASEFVFHGAAPQNTWAQVLDDHGRPAGAAKIVDTLLHSQAAGTVLFALPGKPSDKLFQFIWMQCGNGILKLNLQVTP